MTADLVNKRPITVILVDDHPVVRAGYRHLFESTADIHVVAEAGDGESGYILYQKYQPDVTILDLNMEGMGGLETLHRIKTKNPDARILVFSMHTNETLIQRILKAGALGYITKQSGMNQMIQAVRLVNEGKIFIDPEVASSMVSNFTNKNREDPLSALTPREFQIFKLLAEGSSCAQIAEIISISPKTVGVHHCNIMRKLKLQNPIQLVRLAISCDII